MLSAYEYGQRGVKEGHSNAFSELTSFEKAKPFMQRYVAVWALWTGYDRVLTVRYEDMVQNYEDEIVRLTGFLGSDPAMGSVQAVFDKYRPERGDQGQKGMHISKGKAERFRSIFTADQLEEFTQAFQPVIEQMGYSL
jgi:hypothetical protein